MKKIKIIANGIYIPKNKITNEYLSKQLQVTPEYIKQRTGIETRYYVNDETIEDMAINVSKQAIYNAKIKKDDIDMIIVATTCGMQSMPGISYVVQKELNIENCSCIDILAGCSGYINAFDIARNEIALEKIRTALIIGVDILSKYTDPNDLSTKILLADGAGATVITGTNESKMYYSYINSCGQQGDMLTYQPLQYIKMEGKQIYKYAVTQTIQNINTLLRNSGQQLERVKYVIPHQSNKKIMDSIAQKLDIPKEKIYQNIKEIGNTFCASIPIALYQILKANKIKRGDCIILLGYGGGLNTGSILLQF